MSKEIEVITNLSNKDVFRVAHKFTTLKGCEWKPKEIDFLLAFASEIKKSDDNFKKYTIPIQEIAKKIDMRYDKSRLLPLFKGLANKKIQVDDEDKEAVYNVFSELERDKKTDKISVVFGSAMKPFLLRLKPFTQGYLSDILKCESVYEKKLYLFLAKWLDAGSVKVEVEWLMNELQVAKSYKYADFKRVLLKAQNNFLAKELHIRFYFEEIKKNRKVVELEFDVLLGRKREQKLFDEYEENETLMILPYLGRQVFIRSLQKSGTITQIQEEAHDKGKWVINAELNDDGTVKILMPYMDLASMLASLQSSNFEV